MMADVGKIHAYVGTMGAGKTKKLVSIFNRLSGEGKHVVVFKHVNDVQRGGHVDMVVARNGDSAPAVAIKSLTDILMYETDRKFDAVLIDEIQFFDDEYTVEVLEGMAYAGIDVYVFGLDVTSELVTFGQMGDILAVADEVKKLKCRCHKCGAPARVSAYVGKDRKEGAIKVGDIGDYQPTCRACFYNDIDVEDSQKSVNEEVQDEDDEFYEFRLRGKDFDVELGVYRSELDKAGYTAEDVRDINSYIGVTNLLKDLGYV
jgi:thymidine kinase